ncbi:MAG: hypothetical protein ACHREM_31900, partial [Polyangiales bacterium]
VHRRSGTGRTSVMNAARVFKTVDAQLVTAVPELQRFSGQRVELIVLEAPEASPRARRRLSVDELLARRRPRPEGVEAVTVESMNEAIAEEAARRAGV